MADKVADKALTATVGTQRYRHQTLLGFITIVLGITAKQEEK
jgi:hypothetical protein